MEVILLLLDFRSEVPIFLQIAQSVEDDIIKGIFKEETQIPSTTEISINYKINPATVLKGYNLLVDEQIIYKKRGVGMFVCESARQKLIKKRKEAFYKNFVINLLSEAKKLGIETIEVIEMIKRDWNHSSIVLWGVRINESLDDHDFYFNTNMLSHNADKSRQTCGVRCHTNSELLEDVYSLNDFVHSGGEVALRDQKEVTGLIDYVPYIVTEYNGHMYPTKRYDSEERQM
jgi:DNA-binding transcriptional regulator YhcF (GntR family)